MKETVTFLHDREGTAMRSMDTSDARMMARRSFSSRGFRPFIMLLWLSVTAMLGVSLAPSAAVAAVPGANGRIVFIGLYGYMYSMNPDGSGVRTLRMNDGDAFPVWSPDGGRIAFLGGPDEAQVVVMNADGTGAHEVAAGGAPAWSPDGMKLAFSGPDGGIWTSGADGTGLTQLTSLDDHDPAWSPDGASIVFSRYDGATVEDHLWKMNADGTNPTQLTNNVLSDLFADWSPDGTKIVFERTDRNGSGQVVVMNTDGTGQTPLTSLGQNEYPFWSPDGTLIGFGSTRGSGLWTMNPDGSSQTRATTTPAARQFDWQATNLTLKASKPIVTYPGSVTVTAHLTDYATTENTTVSIYKTPFGGSRTLVGSGNVGSSGDFSVTTTLTKRTSFVAVWSGDAEHPAGGTSSAVTVLVRALVTGRLSGHYAVAGQYRLFHYSPSCPRYGTHCPHYTAAVKPNHAGQRVYFSVQIYYSGRWHNAGSFSGRLGSRSSVTERLVYSGPEIKGLRTRIRARFLGDPDHAAAKSRWAYFKITA